MHPLPDFLLPLEFETRPFPHAAVEEAIARREETIPHLLAALEWADTHTAEANAPGRMYFLHLYALYLLAQFRETRAYPLVVRLFRNPDYEALTGDVTTESLPSILASVCGGNLAPIKDLIEEPGADEWVRGAAMRALEVLVHTGSLAVAELSGYIGELFGGKLEREASYIWDAVVSTCDTFRMREHLDAVRRAYHEELADEMHIGLDEVEEEMALPPGDSLYGGRERYQGLIDSAVDELEGWDCFRVRTPEEEAREAAQARMALLDEALPEHPDYVDPLPGSTYVRESPKVGRNDPCPCGSGRKFKKCCGAAA